VRILKELAQKELKSRGLKVEGGGEKPTAEAQSALGCRRDGLHERERLFFLARRTPFGWRSPPRE